MNAYSKAIAEVSFRIPRQILEAVFLQRVSQWRVVPMSLEEEIMSRVVRPRVAVDCDLVGGTEMYVGLADVPMVRISDYSTVYQIPKSKTNGRSIVSVLNVTFTDPNQLSNYGMSAACQNTAMMQMGQAVMDAFATIPTTSTATTQLIGENRVMVRDTVSLPANAYLRCRVANDEEMSHIQPRYYRAFARLVELAVKAYIFNEYSIPMDIGELHGGMTLGRFKDRVDEYADAEELYQQYLDEKWTKMSLMNDRESYQRLIRLGLGGNR